MFFACFPNRMGTSKFKKLGECYMEIIESSVFFSLCWLKNPMTFGKLLYYLLKFCSVFGKLVFASGALCRF